jgi:hypothetical protein
MSESLNTKPVVYVQSAVNGVVTCIEQRMRPEDFGNVFPENQFPTFPAINTSLTRAMLPIELAYGILPKNTKLPIHAAPAEQWETSEKHWLHTIQTSGYTFGTNPFDKDTAFYTDRVFTYKNEPPPSDLPYYNPNDYDILEPVAYPVDLSRDMGGDMPQIITVIPKGSYSPDPGQFANESSEFYYNPQGGGIIEDAMVENAFLFLYSGIIFGSGLHVIKDGTGGIDSIHYHKETVDGEPNPSCAIYGFDPLSPYHPYISTDSGFHGNTETERAMVRVTMPTAPILSHVITPTEESSILPSLVCLGGMLGLVLAGASINNDSAAAAARRRLRRGTK